MGGGTVTGGGGGGLCWRRGWLVGRAVVNE